jgi:predicted TIM-barrel fold metal-dependent hydrolase
VGGARPPLKQTAGAVSDEPFIDAHIHFWDQSVDGLQWAWLRSGFSFRRWDASDELDAPRYTPPEFRDEAAGTGLAGAVHLHCAHPIADPVRETEWLEAVADEHGMPEAIVGACLLGRPDAADVLRRHVTHRRVRGVRDWESLTHLEVDEIAAAMDVAAALGLSIELRRAHDEFAVLDEIAARWPSVTITLSHACLPLERSTHEFLDWSAAMRRLARHENVMCKISAVAGASDPDWTPASIRPWILACVEHFGAERCMLGSNFPVDRLFGSYRSLIDAYREVTAELDPAERAALFHGTAERVYRLGLGTQRS